MVPMVSWNINTVFLNKKKSYSLILLVSFNLKILFFWSSYFLILLVSNLI